MFLLHKLLESSMVIQMIILPICFGIVGKKLKFRKLEVRHYVILALAFPQLHEVIIVGDLEYPFPNHPNFDHIEIPKMNNFKLNLKSVFKMHTSRNREIWKENLLE